MTAERELKNIRSVLDGAIDEAKETSKEIESSIGTLEVRISDLEEDREYLLTVLRTLLAAEEDATTDGKACQCFRCRNARLDADEAIRAVQKKLNAEEAEASEEVAQQLAAKGSLAKIRAARI